MPVQQTAGKLKVEIEGQELPDDIDHLLQSATVESDTNEPDRFVLTFRDADRHVLQKTGAKIGAKVAVTSFSDASTAGDKLLAGEVTALEIEHDSTGTFTIVRGYDISHRLFRGRRSETYQNVTYSDVVTKVAQRAGLPAGTIDPCSPVHPFVGQSNQSDWQFLQVLARDVGYHVAVTDGKLDFRKPHPSSDGPGRGNLETTTPLELTMGAHILRLRSSVTAAEQVPTVEVRGWDPKQKQAVVGSSPSTTSSATLPVKPADLAQLFASPKLVGAGVPYATQAEVDHAAQGLADHIAGTFAELDGVARGNPKLKAGTAISLSLAGDPFDGKYTLTSVRHVYSPDDGYTTAFVVSGRNQRSLLGLASAGASSPAGSGPPGVVPAIVTDVNDPDELGRVRLKFPWLSDTYTSDWTRMVQAGAGSQRGAVFLPEVNDEVLVAFDRGDWRQPYVLGGLYNGVDKPSLGGGLIDGSSGAVKRRGIVSKNGHLLAFFDDAGKDGVALLTGGKGLKISLNQGQTTIKITSSGNVNIEGSKEVSIKAGTNLSVQGGSKLSLKAPSIEISADSDVTVSGNPIKLN